MKLSRGKLSIILFLLGFLFIVLDVNIDTGIAYPNNYNNSDNVIGEFQYYNIKSTYGASCTYKMIEDKHDSSLSDDNSDAVSTNEAKVIDKVFFDNIHIDIFNDIVGFILIAIAAFLLKNKGSRQFNYAILLCIISLILSIIIYILPFFVNGILLWRVLQKTRRTRRFLFLVAVYPGSGELSALRKRRVGAPGDIRSLVV